MADRWGDVNQATAILSRNAGRNIDVSYVRSLVRAGKISCRPKDGRTNEYNLSECEKYFIRPKSGPRGEQRVRDKRSGRPGGRPRKVQPAKKEDEHQALDLVG